MGEADFIPHPDVVGGNMVGLVGDEEDFLGHEGCLEKTCVRSWERRVWGEGGGGGGGRRL